MRIATGALVAACWLALATGEIRGDVVPMLPYLCGAMVLILAVRSLVLRSRAAAWRAAAITEP